MLTSRLLPLLALLACGPAATPPGTDASADVRSAIAALDSVWFARDTAAVSRLMAPEYTYFSSRGDVHLRPAFLAFLAHPHYTLLASTRSEITPRFAGPTAIVETRWKGHGTWQEGAFEDDQRCSMVWVRDGAAWKVLSEHCTQIVPAPAS